MFQNQSGQVDPNSSQSSLFLKIQSQSLFYFDDGACLSNSQNKIDQSDRWPQVSSYNALSQINQFQVVKSNEIVEQSQKITNRQFQNKTDQSDRWHQVFNYNSQPYIQQTDQFQKSNEIVEQSQIKQESSEQQSWYQEYQSHNKTKKKSKNSAKNCYNSIKQAIIKYLKANGQHQLNQLIINYEKSGNNKMETQKLIKNHKLAAKFAKMFRSNYLKFEMQLSKMPRKNLRQVCRQIEILKKYFTSQSPSLQQKLHENADIYDICLR